MILGEGVRRVLIFGPTYPMAVREEGTRLEVVLSVVPANLVAAVSAHLALGKRRKLDSEVLRFVRSPIRWPHRRMFDSMQDHVGEKQIAPCGKGSARKKRAAGRRLRVA